MRSFFIAVAVIVATLISHPAYAGKKPVMAVDEFKNDSSAAWWSGGTGRDLAGMLTNEMGSTGAFKMVERKKVDSVLREQDLGASGRIRPKTAAKIGKMTGAQYLVMATVTSFERNTKSTGGGISFGGISIGGKSDKAYMAVDLRVVDTTTGDIEFTRTVEATSSGGGLSLGFFKGGFGGSLGGQEKTPVGKAIRACVMEISDYLECAMIDQDDCMDEYRDKERKRRKKTKGSIDLE